MAIVEGQPIGHACAHCGGQLVYVRAEDGVRWLPPLDPPNRAAEAAPGRVLVVQVDGEWRTVPRVREMVFHVCPVQPPAPSAVRPALAVAPRLRQARERGARLVNERQRAEERRIEQRAHGIELRMATYWKPGSRANETLAVVCPEERCTAPVGVACRSFDKDARNEVSGAVLMGPHPSRRRLLPKSEKQLAKEAAEAANREERARRQALEDLKPLVSWLQVARIARQTGDPDELGEWLAGNAGLFDIEVTPITTEPEPDELVD